MSDDILNLQPFHPFKVTLSNNKKSIRYGAIDSHSGILASIADEGIYFYDTMKYEELSLNSKLRRDKLIDVGNFLKINCDSEVSWLEFNCSGSFLLAAILSENGYVMHIKVIDVERTINEYKEILICSFKPNSECKLQDLKWHPIDKNCLLMVLSDTVYLCTIKDNEFVINNSKSNAFCVSWSPKGKQFSVIMQKEGSKNFVVNQFDNSMIEKRSTEILNLKNEFKVSFDLIPIEVCWYSTFHCIIGFRGDTNGNEQYKIYVCNFAIKLNKIQILTDVGSSSDCINPNPGPLARLYYLHILEWNTIVLVNNSAENAVIYEYDVNNNNLQVIATYCLPIEGNVIGLSCDFTSNITLPDNWLSSEIKQSGSNPILLLKLSNSDCFGIYLLHSQKKISDDIIKKKISVNHLNLHAVESSKNSISDQFSKFDNSASRSIDSTEKSMNKLNSDIIHSHLHTQENSINIFSGENPNKSIPQSSLFGTQNQDKSIPQSNLFGIQNQDKSTTQSNLFGIQDQDKSTPQSSLFGTQNQVKSIPKSNVFGTQNQGKITNKLGLLSGASKDKSTPKTSIFENQNKENSVNQEASVTKLENQPQNIETKSIGQTEPSSINRGKLQEIKSSGGPINNFQKPASGDHEKLIGSERKKECTVIPRPDSKIKKSTYKDSAKNDIIDNFLPVAIERLSRRIEDIKIKTNDLIKQSRKLLNDNERNKQISSMFQCVEQYRTDVSRIDTTNKEMIDKSKTLFQDIDITLEFTTRFQAEISDSKIKNKQFRPGPNPLLKKTSSNLDELWKKVDFHLKDLEDALDYIESKRNSKATIENETLQLEDINRSLKSNIKLISIERSKIDLLREHLHDSPVESNDLLQQKISNLQAKYVNLEMEKHLYSLMCKRPVNNLSCKMLESKASGNTDKKIGTNAVKHSESNRKLHEPIKTESKLPISGSITVKLVDRDSYKSTIKSTEKINQDSYFNPNPTTPKPLSTQFTSISAKDKSSLSTSNSYPDMASNTKLTEENLINTSITSSINPSFTNKFETENSKSFIKVESGINSDKSAALATNLSKSIESKHKSVIAVSTPGEIISQNTSINKSTSDSSNVVKNEINAFESSTTAISQESIPLEKSPSEMSSISFILDSSIINNKSSNNLSDPISVTPEVSTHISNNISTKPSSSGLLGSPITINSSSLALGPSSSNKSEGTLFGNANSSNQNGSAKSPELFQKILTTKPSEETNFNKTNQSSGTLFSSPVATTAQSLGIFKSNTSNILNQNNSRLSSSPLTSTTITQPSGPFTTPTTNKSNSGLFSNSNISNQSTTGLFGSPITTTVAQSSGLFATSTTNKSNSGLFGNSNISTKSTTGLFGSPITTTVAQSSRLFATSSTNKPNSGLFGTSNTSTQSTTGLFGSPISTTGISQSLGFFSSPTSSTAQNEDLFGTPKATNPISNNLFGSSANTEFPISQSTTTSNKSTGGLFGNSPADSKSGGGIFGSTGVFGSSTSNKTSGGLFGNSNQSDVGIFGSSKNIATTSQSTGMFGSATNSGLFGNSSTSNQTSNSIFSSSSNITNQSTGLFGQISTNTSNTSLFSNPVSQSSGMFGTSSTNNKVSGGLFGHSTSTNPPAGFFGKNAPTPNTGLFASPIPSNQSSSSTLFGTPTTQTNLFNSNVAKTQQENATGFSFGSSSFISGLGGNQSSNNTKNIFASTNTSGSASGSSNLFAPNNTPSNLFSASSNTGSIFGNNASVTSQQSTLFGSRPVFGNTNENSLQSGGLFPNSVFGNVNDSPMTFGDMATNNENQPAFGINSNQAGNIFQTTTSPSFTQRRM